MFLNTDQYSLTDHVAVVANRHARYFFAFLLLASRPSPFFGRFRFTAGFPESPWFCKFARADLNQ